MSNKSSLPKKTTARANVLDDSENLGAISSQEELKALKPHIGLEYDDDGELVGCDPKTLSRDELASLGHFKKSAMKIIRDKCIDCCVGQIVEVRKCVATDCPNWPYRMATNPLTGRTGNATALRNKCY